MCDTCGCLPPPDHRNPEGGRKIRVETEILSRNNLLASRNRALFREKRVLALNLVSSPGSGKTTLLERTLRDCSPWCRCAVISGDQHTDNDARRVAAAGVPVRQVNTGTACHLDAHMVAHAVEDLDLDHVDLLFIENVGNLVCPAPFDLGEELKVVVFSVTEGEDKPLKYPYIFHAAPLLLLNKTDLLPHLDFDPERCIEMARRVNPQVEVFRLSARTGEGMEGWYRWLQSRLEVTRKGG